MPIDPEGLKDISGLVRCEDYSRDELGAMTLEMTHAVYPHAELYGEFCTIQDFIACPPELVYQYMANIHSLEEWTYSVRDLKRITEDGLYQGRDAIGSKFFARVEANPKARTVDYLCAWDQGDELWMIYINRVVDAQKVFKKPGSVVLWTNCHHPYYDRNPFPELNDIPDRMWVGEMWDLFYAGHTLEFRNLKAILEYRYKRGLPMGPLVVGED
jgi:hypothetical protein